jgi:hypothetical protein
MKRPTVLRRELDPRRGPKLVKCAQMVPITDAKCCRQMPRMSLAEITDQGIN